MLLYLLLSCTSCGRWELFHLTLLSPWLAPVSVLCFAALSSFLASQGAPGSFWVFPAQSQNQPFLQEPQCLLVDSGARSEDLGAGHVPHSLAFAAWVSTPVLRSPSHASPSSSSCLLFPQDCPDLVFRAVRCLDTSWIQNCSSLDGELSCFFMWFDFRVLVLRRNPARKLDWIWVDDTFGLWFGSFVPVSKNFTDLWTLGR